MFDDIDDILAADYDVKGEIKPVNESVLNEFLPIPQKKSNVEDVLDVLEQAFRLDSTLSGACTLAGIRESEYYAYMESHPEAKLRMEQAKQRPQIIAHAAVFKEMNKGNAKVALKFLEMRDKRYKAIEEIQDEVIDNSKVVQFISVNTNKGDEKNQNDGVEPIEQKSVCEGYSSSGGEDDETKMTGWDNEDAMLKRLSS